GAKASGVKGFVQGVGKGIIGAFAQPVSVVIDLLSQTTEGANVIRIKITAAITSEDLLCRRLPMFGVVDGCTFLVTQDAGELIVRSFT
ncbi:calcium-dependent lipid-binding family protein, partial [Tanacetum coccineum]